MNNLLLIPTNELKLFKSLSNYTNCGILYTGKPIYNECVFTNINVQNNYKLFKNFMIESLNNSYLNYVSDIKITDFPILEFEDKSTMTLKNEYTIIFYAIDNTDHTLIKGFLVTKKIDFIMKKVIKEINNKLFNDEEKNKYIENINELNKYYESKIAKDLLYSDDHVLLEYEFLSHFINNPNIDDYPLLCMIISYKGKKEISYAITLFVPDYKNDRILLYIIRLTTISNYNLLKKLFQEKSELFEYSNNNTSINLQLFSNDLNIYKKILNFNKEEIMINNNKTSVMDFSNLNSIIDLNSNQYLEFKNKIINFINK